MGNREITPFNRNSCQYCRLKKCIAVGMNRETSRLGRRPKRLCCDTINIIENVREQTSDSSSIFKLFEQDIQHQQQVELIDKDTNILKQQLSPYRLYKQIDPKKQIDSMCSRTLNRFTSPYEIPDAKFPN